MSIVIDDVFLEERADYLGDSVLKSTTVGGDHFDKIKDGLLSNGTKLIIGPRGCGKTHIMRYTWLQCVSDDNYPLSLYVSFNKYFRLEPLLKSKTNATSIFHGWVLAKVLLSAYDFCQAKDIPDNSVSDILISSRSNIEALVSKLELQIYPSGKDAELFNDLSVSNVIRSIERLCDLFGRKRVVVFLDDAAITLTPEYLYEFFDIVRALKTPKLSLKASVYPGTTEYGPNFHVDHEAEAISSWLSVNDSSYSDVMENIGIKRITSYESIPSDVRELLKYASFGIPRAYLTMLRFYLKSNSRGQKRTNDVLQYYTESRINEYLSLKTKLPKFSNLIEQGNLVLNNIFKIMIEQNRTLILEGKNTNQLLIGIQEDDNVLFSRMIQLLIEVGLLYPISKVKHGKNADGKDRYYMRYIPHLAFLIIGKAFSPIDSKTASSEYVVDVINKKQEHHPVRRSPEYLLRAAGISFSDLKWVLPPCRYCQTERVSDNQRFCHECGNRVVDVSTFSQCMSFQLRSIPGLSSFLISKIDELDALYHIKTISDFLAIQDPGSKLRNMSKIGIKRAEKIIKHVNSYVDEFLS